MKRMTKTTIALAALGTGALLWAPSAHAAEATYVVTVGSVTVNEGAQPTASVPLTLSEVAPAGTPAKGEKPTKEHLPLLRAIAVRSLSRFTLAQASSMTVEQVAAQLNKTFDANYASEERDKPFGEVMIGKLIVE